MNYESKSTGSKARPEAPGQDTQAAGEYPGGVATVVRLAPDPKAPGVVFQVHLGQWGELGVSGQEDVSLLADGLGAIQLPANWRN
jgi:hypothetical protein